ncbi:MAG: metallophosphoesterase [Firmicutes bacterium]|nr:metallophosphoesterase [Bacillota bacterium]
MSVWIISDFHLSLSEDFVPGQPPQLYKPMHVFGEEWRGHVERLYANWLELVQPEDTVLVPGDLSWAISLQEGRFDFAFLGMLPGRIILSKGNHDYWWDTKAKAQSALPPNVTVIQNEAWQLPCALAAATRGWKCPGANGFDGEDAKIYRRECLRLEMALQDAVKKRDAAGGSLPIWAVLHFPPVNDKRDYSEMIELMQKYGVERCFYGHLHGMKREMALQGMHWGIEFALVSSDFLGHRPLLIG